MKKKLFINQRVNKHHIFVRYLTMKAITPPRGVVLSGQRNKTQQFVSNSVTFNLLMRQLYRSSKAILFMKDSDLQDTVKHESLLLKHYICGEHCVETLYKLVSEK